MTRRPAIPETEAGIQAAIVEALRLMGYRVMEVGKGRRACEACGHVNRGWAGNTPGVGDLLVTRPGSGNVWVMLDTKTATGRPTKGRLVARGRRWEYIEGQEDLVRAGCLHLVRSVEEAVSTVQGDTGGDR